MDSCSIEITMDVYAHADTEQARAELKRIKPKLDELTSQQIKLFQCLIWLNCIIPSLLGVGVFKFIWLLYESVIYSRMYSNFCTIYARLCYNMRSREK